MLTSRLTLSYEAELIELIELKDQSRDAEANLGISKAGRWGDSDVEAEAEGEAIERGLNEAIEDYSDNLRWKESTRPSWWGSHILGNKGSLVCTVQYSTVL